MSLPLRVSVSGNDFVINGVAKPLFMRSSFSTMAYLSNWAEGQGGFWESAVDYWFERVKSQGFDGVRVFGETSGWRRGNSAFFSKQATPDNIWNLNALRAGIRPVRLTVLNQKIILKLIEKLQKHGLVAEYVTDATLKHDGVSAGTIGHCIRQTARFFYHIENRIIDPDVIVPYLIDQFRDVLESGDINIFHELHNEWDAHNQAGLDLGELELQFVRHRRYTNGEPGQWPRGIVGVSHGGRNEIEYPVSRPNGADYVALHPERSGEWWTYTDLERRYSHKPRYYNESKCYLSPREWTQWVETGVFGANACTKDLTKYMKFMDETMHNGISFCVHDFVGMASGFFNGQELPTSLLEEELGGITPPPPPPDEYEIFVSDTDPRGHFNVKIEFKNQPAVINSTTDYTKKLDIPLGETSYVYKIDTFNGLDREDIVEMDTFIYDKYGRVLYQRSLHKETPAMFNSYWPIATDAVTDEITVHMHAHVTDPDQPPDKQARAHWNVVLWCAPWK